MTEDQAATARMDKRDKGDKMSEYEVTIKLESSKYNELIVLEKRGDDYGIAW